MNRAFLDDFQTTVETAAARLLAMSEDRAAARPAPGKWSAKEVMLRHNLDVLAFRPVDRGQPATLEYFMRD